MAADGKINLEMLIRVAADQARRELEGLTGATRGLTAETRGFGAAGGAAGPVLDSFAAGARNAQTGLVGVTAALAAQETAMQRAIASWAGLSNASAESTAAGLRYGMMLDDIRARYNPLFAASRQYELILRDISEAERLGAISAREAAAARERAAGMIAPAGQPGQRQGGGIGNAYTANIGAQGFDIGVTAAMGMHPMMIGFQQGSQLAGIAQQMGGGAQAARGLAQGLLSIVNPTSLVTIGLTAMAAFGVQGLMKLAGSAKSVEERMEELTTAFARYKATMAIAGASSDDLVRQFGVAAGSAQGLYAVLANLDRLQLDQKLKATGSAIRETLSIPRTDPRLEFASPRMASFFGLGGGTSALNAHGEAIEAFKAAIKEVESAEGLDAQTAAMQTLLAQVGQLATLKGGITKEEQTLIDLIKERADVLLGIQAIETARAEAISRQVDQMALGYRQEAELLALTTQYGAQSAEVERLKAQHARDNLALRLEAMDVEKGSLDWLRARVELALKLSAEEQAALDTRQQWVADQQDRLGAIARETSLIGASNAERLRTNALAEAEVEIRRQKMGLLEAEEHRTRAIARAAAEADLEQRRALHAIGVTRMIDGYDARISAERNPQTRAAIEAEREYARVMAQTNDAVQAAAAAEQVRARAMSDLRLEQADFLRGQQEALQQLQLELALVGQTAAVRARTLALAQAERDILRLGLTGEDAERLRRQAEAQAELGRVIETQADAWKRVQSAGEDAIDGVLDKLRGGDIKGAFGAVIGEIEGMFFDLSIRNPLKNAILGTDLGTWGDVGGLGGIWGRLTGANRVDERGLAAQAAMPVQSMMVTAANVTLGGPGLSGLLSVSTANAGGGFGAAGGTGAAGGISVAGLGTTASVQQQVWAFFAAKGLAPHQIAGIMGNVAAESAFNPLAVGDAGQAFGLFQHNDRKGSLFDFIGGQGNLGNVQAQLEFAWQELMTSENGPFRRLMASTNVYDATHAFTGFERPQGYSASDPQSAHGWDRRLAGAEAAMAKFEGTTVTAQAQLGQLGTGAAQLGTGLQSFGANIAGTLQGIGASYGPGGAFVGSLLGEGLKWLTGGGFAAGGWTGPGATTDVAGVVHAEEYVFDAAATRRIGVANLEAMRRGALRGYREGGYVVGGQPPIPVRASGSGPAEAGRRASDSPVSTINIRVNGTGNSEIKQGVMAAIEEAFDRYDRTVFAGRVRMVLNDDWAG